PSGACAWPKPGIVRDPFVAARYESPDSFTFRRDSFTAIFATAPTRAAIFARVKPSGKTTLNCRSCRMVVVGGAAALDEPGTTSAAATAPSTRTIKTTATRRRTRIVRREGRGGVSWSPGSTARASRGGGGQPPPRGHAGGEGRTRQRVLRGGACRLLCQIGREPLVEQLDRDVEDALERLGEALGLGRLLRARAAQRQRQSDGDPPGRLLP